MLTTCVEGVEYSSSLIECRSTLSCLVPVDVASGGPGLLEEISSGVTLGAVMTYKLLVYNRCFQIYQTLDFLPLFRHSTKSSDIESVSTLKEALLSEGQCRIVSVYCRWPLTITKVELFS